MSRFLLSFVFLLTAPFITHAQEQIKVEALYIDNCSGCHGEKLDGGNSPSLVDDEWVHDTSAASLAAVIKNGVAETEMAAFGEMMGDDEIRALVIYIKEMEAKSKVDAIAARMAPKGGIFRSADHKFKMTKLFDSDGRFWSVNFLPNGDMITTLKDKNLYIVKDGELVEITGIPDIWVRGQGGLLSVAPHPDYEKNGWIYLSYSARGDFKIKDKDTGMTMVVRGRIKDNQWIDNEVLFVTKPEHGSDKGAHFGSRFVFDKGYLYFGIGDRGYQDKAQDISLPNGNIYRIHDDGRVPADNPFVDVKDAYAEIWSYGHRNPQGLAMHPVTGDLYDSEHGPRGGDEINLIKKGANYGWPVITYGMNYNGTPITDITEKDGMEQPLHYWTPSIAVSAMVFYTSNAFPAWKNDLLVGSLAKQELWRLRLDGDKLVSKELILKDQGRLRSIRVGPDGAIYLTVDADDAGRGGIYKLEPVE